MLSVNSTLFIHFFIFIAVVIVCIPLLIKPTMALLDERAEHISGAIDKARILREETDARVREIEEQVTKSRRKAIAEREEVRLEYVQKAEGMIADARQSAQDQIADMRNRIAKERDGAQKTLAAGAEALSKEIAQRVLGRKVA